MKHLQCLRQLKSSLHRVPVSYSRLIQYLPTCDLKLKIPSPISKYRRGEYQVFKYPLNLPPRRFPVKSRKQLLGVGIRFSRRLKILDVAKFLLIKY